MLKYLILIFSLILFSNQNFAEVKENNSSKIEKKIYVDKSNTTSNSKKTSELNLYLELQKPNNTILKFYIISKFKLEIIFNESHHYFNTHPRDPPVV